VIARPDLTVASLGYNGFARGMQDSHELYQDREMKLSRVIHAEMNALLTAKESLAGYTLYVFPFSPCERCAVHVIQAGITRVVVPAPSEEQLARWGDSFERTRLYFQEAGVELEVLADE